MKEIHKKRMSKVIYYFFQVISAWPEGTNTVCYVAHFSGHIMRNGDIFSPKMTSGGRKR